MLHLCDWRVVYVGPVKRVPRVRPGYCRVRRLEATAVGGADVCEFYTPADCIRSPHGRAHRPYYLLQGRTACTALAGGPKMQASSTQTLVGSISAYVQCPGCIERSLQTRADYSLH